MVASSASSASSPHAVTNTAFEVRFDGVFGEKEGAADFLVAAAFDEELQHFHFAIAQRFDGWQQH